MYGIVYEDANTNGIGKTRSCSQLANALVVAMSLLESDARVVYRTELFFLTFFNLPPPLLSSSLMGIEESLLCRFGEKVGKRKICVVENDWFCRKTS
jgi:hypothetical protein